MLFTNEIYNMDCLEGLKQLDDECIDLTVTSPPYDNLRAYDGFQFDFEAIAKELFRVTKTGGAVVWICGDASIKETETGTSFKQALYFKEVGFKLHDTMIYQKQNFIPLNHNRYDQQFEFMFILVKGKLKTFNPLMVKTKTAGAVSALSRKGYGFHEGSYRRRNENYITKSERMRGNIWDYATGNSKVDHPAVFPEMLANDHIQSWSNEGDLVLDPFMGSGTTAKMSIILNRRFIGFEISKKYCEVAKRRIDYYRRQTTIYTDFNSIGGNNETDPV